MKLSKEVDELIAADNPVIPYIEGDGIGKEITPFVKKDN
jgi:isocitrate dehydrogenase